MDMTMIVKYKVSSFLYLHNDFWYNSLGSTCTCQSLIVGTNVKLNFQFVDRPIVNHCEGQGGSSIGAGGAQGPYPQKLHGK